MQEQGELALMFDVENFSAPLKLLLQELLLDQLLVLHLKHVLLQGQVLQKWARALLGHLQVVAKNRCFLFVFGGC
jgi:hypothetical protein